MYCTILPCSLANAPSIDQRSQTVSHGVCLSLLHRTYVLLSSSETRIALFLGKWRSCLMGCPAVPVALVEWPCCLAAWLGP